MPDTTCAPTVERSTEHRGVAVDQHLDALDDLEALRAPRALLIERGRRRRHGRGRAAALSLAASLASFAAEPPRPAGFAEPDSADTMRISTVSSEVSALMRLMSAAPRDFFANRRSMATMSGRPVMMASSAAGVSASVNA